MSDLFYQESRPISSSQLPESYKKPRQVFVAYSYKLYPKDDYRRVFTEIKKAFDVEFIFADEKITNIYILQKIADAIRISRFGIYDISGWNANVTLELGLAYGLNQRAFIAIDPSKTEIQEVPADLRGIDRIQYSSYTELQEGISKLVAQELPIQRKYAFEDQLQQLRKDALAAIAQSDGIKMNDIATLLGISTDMAKLVVRPLVGKEIESTGSTRATKYFPKTNQE
jgi:hypothetical protein